MQPFDRTLGLRALGMTLVGLALALGVVVATDEPYSTAGMRVARLSAFTPAIAALGAAAALGEAGARGELRALGALGATPFRAGLGAMLAAWFAGAVALGFLASPLADPSSLFPAIGVRHAWAPDARGLVDEASGLRILPSGALEILAITNPASGPSTPRTASALFAVTPLAIVTPIWVTSPLRLWARTTVALLALAVVVFLLHAVAAERLAPAWLVLAAAPLAVQAAAGHLVRRVE
jgi:hypothetical protein